MGGWLIYHPERVRSVIGGLTVYHDTCEGNQDPYIWNERFLHTACHMTQMSPEVGDLNFWVSGDTFPGFSKLVCDLVFDVEAKCYWEYPNTIQPDDKIVDSSEAYADHYWWMPRQHHLTKRRRFTLKAKAASSFQPERADASLIDIVPALQSLGLELPELRKGLRAGFAAKPMRLPNNIAASLSDFLCEAADFRIGGGQLQSIRRANPLLGSPHPAR